MYDNNNWTRLDEGRVEEVLKDLGLTQALDDFLMMPGMMDMYHDLFVSSCAGLKDMIKDMPEEVREILLKRLADEYETAEHLFTDSAVNEFKLTLVEINCINSQLLGDGSGVVMCYKQALEAGSEQLKANATDIAEMCLDEFVKAFKKSWLIHLPHIEDQDTIKAILKAALGDEAPDLDACTVVPINLAEMLSYLAGEGEGDEDDE